jgi:hypothetical protein
MLQGGAYIVFIPDDITKDKAMTALVLNTANRSAAFFSSFIDALDTAITMAKAVYHDSPNAADMKKVRAIAESF